MNCSSTVSRGLGLMYRDQPNLVPAASCRQFTWTHPGVNSTSRCQLCNGLPGTGKVPWYELSNDWMPKHSEYDHVHTFMSTEHLISEWFRVSASGHTARVQPQPNGESLRQAGMGWLPNMNVPKHQAHSDEVFLQRTLCSLYQGFESCFAWGSQGPSCDAVPAVLQPLVWVLPPPPCWFHSSSAASTVLWVHSLWRKGSAKLIHSSDMLDHSWVEITWCSLLPPWTWDPKENW